MPSDKQKEDAAKLAEWIAKQEGASNFNSDTRNPREQAGFSNAQGDGPADNSHSTDFAYGRSDQPSYTSSGQSKKKGDSKKSKK